MGQAEIKLNRTEKIVDDNGQPTQLFNTFLLKLARNTVIVGIGSPEGVYNLPQYTLYVDETTPTSPVTYRKMLRDITGDKSKGWVVT